MRRRRDAPQQDTSSNKKQKCNDTSLTAVLPQELIGILVSYLSTSDWLQFSYTCRQVNALKYDRRLMIDKMRTLKTNLAKDVVDKSLRAARGTLFSVDFGSCSQCVTDDTFAHLQGTIHELHVVACSSISDKAFAYLQGSISKLEIRQCTTITDQAFSYLQGTIKVLDMEECETISDKGLSFLEGTIEDLDISYCSQITSEGFSYLKGIKRLRMRGYRGLRDKAFSYLQGSIEELDMSDGDQLKITDRAFSYLQGTIKILEMRDCDQRSITDEAFKYIADTIKVLDMRGCTQSTITDKAFEYLSNGPITQLTLHRKRRDRAARYFTNKAILQSRY